MDRPLTRQELIKIIARNKGYRPIRDLVTEIDEYSSKTPGASADDLFIMTKMSKIVAIDEERARKAKKHKRKQKRIQEREAAARNATSQIVINNTVGNTNSRTTGKETGSFAKSIFAPIAGAVAPLIIGLAIKNTHAEPSPKDLSSVAPMTNAPTPAEPTAPAPQEAKDADKKAVGERKSGS